MYPSLEMQNWGTNAVAISLAVHEEVGVTMISAVPAQVVQHWLPPIGAPAGT